MAEPLRSYVSWMSRCAGKRLLKICRGQSGSITQRTHDEVDLLPSWQLDAMETVKATEECVWIGANVVVVGLEDLEQELVLGVTDRLDDEAIVAREIEKRARLAGRAELGEDVLGCEREEVVGWIKAKELANVTEDPRAVILELEVVLGAGRELVADAARSDRH